MMQNAITVMTVKDLARSLAYYRDRLGFEIAFQYGEPALYAGVFSGDVQLHLIAVDRTTRQAGNGAVRPARFRRGRPRRQHALLRDGNREELKDRTWNSGSTTRPILRA